MDEIYQPAKYLGTGPWQGEYFKQIMEQGIKRLAQTERIQYGS
jgi:hypothetical protein